jgi:hypothetical protein
MPCQSAGHFFPLAQYTGYFTSLCFVFREEGEREPQSLSLCFVSNKLEHEANTRVSQMKTVKIFLNLIY